MHFSSSYIFHNGRKKTPFHVWTAQAIHETCESRTLITSMNHAGVCSSYETLQGMNHFFPARSVVVAENKSSFIITLSTRYATSIVHG